MQMPQFMLLRHYHHQSLRVTISMIRFAVLGIAVQLLPKDSCIYCKVQDRCLSLQPGSFAGMFGVF